MLDIDHVWGSYLYDIRLDNLTNNLSLYLRLHDAQQIELYNLTFKKIIKFKLNFVDDLSWYQAEVTEIYLTKNECLNFEILLWNEDNKMQVFCHDYDLKILDKINIDSEEV